MLKYFFSINLILIISLSSFAQTDIDALRYSQWTSGATARSLGVGGAFGALGGDISSVNINPGGLGVFRASEISLTPAYNLGTISSDFSGNIVDTDKNKFRFAGVGAAFVTLTDRYENDWKATTFAITYNQLANLDKQFNYENVTQGSIAESFLEYADGYLVDDLADPEWLAYQVYMIDDSLYGETNYTSPLGQNSLVAKSEDFEAKGSIYDLGFSVGANYRHKLYLGATIGLPIVNYEQETTYREEDVNNTHYNFDEMSYTTGFATTGIGANLKIGAIYKINRQYRVGLAVHTPTAFGLTDTEYNLEMTKFPSQNGDPPDASLSYDVLEYNLRTSWRFTASGAAIFKKFGFVTADVEWLNYGANRFSFEYSSDECAACESEARFTNNIIIDNYKSAINARLGAEYRYKILRARAGYAYYGNPFDGDVMTASGVQQNISFGLGIRPESVYLDFALVQNVSKELYVPYRTVSSPNVQEINNDIRNTRIVITGGFKF